MKVLLINGSPHEQGCTYTALAEVAAALEGAGVAAEIMHIGADVPGCRACGACRELGCCVIDDAVNEAARRAAEADGFVFGAPVHYASPNGGVLSFLDRLFYSAGKSLAFKPGAAVASARRAGTTVTLDALLKYFTINNMPVVSSRYWSMVHGCTPEQVREDLEGMQVMRQLGRNMAWLLKCLEAGRLAGVPMPESETPVFTSFIR
jgi:multimeric flavodoxin WrbA